MRFVKYVSEETRKELEELTTSAIRLDESLDRGVVVRKSSHIAYVNGMGYPSDYEWESDGKMFYLQSANTGPGAYDFKFVNDKIQITRTGERQGRPATSVFSGAIIAIRMFLEEHPDVKYFRIGADVEDDGRVRLYRRASRLIADECDAEFMGEMPSKKFIDFVYKMKNFK